MRQHHLQTGTLAFKTSRVFVCSCVHTVVFLCKHLHMISSWQPQTHLSVLEQPTPSSLTCLSFAIAAFRNLFTALLSPSIPTCPSLSVWVEYIISVNFSSQAYCTTHCVQHIKSRKNIIPHKLLYKRANYSKLKMYSV